MNLQNGEGREILTDDATLGIERAGKLFYPEYGPNPNNFQAPITGYVIDPELRVIEVMR